MAVHRPRVYLDVNISSEPAGRLVIELFADKAPRTSENFRILCTGDKPPLTYKSAPFHRIIDEFMVQGGDITKSDGTGGLSIYGSEFEDENIGWREIDKEGLVCMANRGRDTNSSQFFITLAPCPHLNAKHTVFGHVVSGAPTLSRMAKVPVDADDKPLTPVLISRCGELEPRKKPTVPTSTTTTAPSSTSRGRKKRRHSNTSPSPARSPSPSRGHRRHSAERYNHFPARSRSRSITSATKSASILSSDTERERSYRRNRSHKKHRRRSDAEPDHALRGRPRHRSRDRTESPIVESPTMSPGRRHRRDRSTPPSRERTRDKGERDAEGRPDFRRQRSFPNQYYEQRERDRYRSEYGNSYGRNNRRGRGPREYGRLGGDEGRLGGGESAGDDGVVYKGRGRMMY